MGYARGFGSAKREGGRATQTIWLEARKLLHPHRENIFAFDLDLDAEGRAQIRALHYGAANPDVAGKICYLCWIEYGVATRVADHRMPRSSVAVFAL